jgi:2-haloacid dehalogenase
MTREKTSHDEEFLMSLSRRQVLSGLASASALAMTSCRPDAAISSQPAAPRSDAKIRMVVFDGFPIFDPRPVLATVRDIGGAKGPAMVATFRTRLFEYQWLRALAGQYRDFLGAARDALLFAGDQSTINVSANDVARLHGALMHLQPWPDTLASLQQLKAKGLELAILSNMTPGMLRAGINGSGLQGMFEHVFSTDSVRTFKPAPRAYAMATEATGRPARQILFVAFAGWDVAGASWFGYPTYWVNRLGSPGERLETTPVGTSR